MTPCVPTEGLDKQPVIALEGALIVRCNSQDLIECIQSIPLLPLDDVYIEPGFG